MGTSSAATRWRHDHRDAVSTQLDVVRMLRRVIEKLLHEADVEKGNKILKGTVQGAFLIVKKKA